ncbi:MAG: quinolinate synthase NadA [Legionellaceae bacterium]|nr:quinolinate synthase NadA [Legionellaceae bacterium]|tara:strand:+ start:1338 stop:2684 length:1347 start_codon:yes stop_codon:yes gene_type:complete
MRSFTEQTDYIPLTNATYQPKMEICQTDYPLDWYQEAFIPYAEEYQALPNRELATVIPWMEKYIKPAQDYFGPQLMLLAHYYMGGEIVKMIDHFGGEVGDSYQLALKAARNPEKKIIVESAVHFMAESISILARPDQQVYITNPKSGCTMEMHAKDYMVEPAFEALNERYGEENILPISYMNTSGRLKAMTGAQGGAVCTSSNVKKIFEWALKQNKKIFFLPDQFMGENVAAWLNIPKEKIAYWPGGNEGAQFNLAEQDADTLKRFDEAKIILFCSQCSVHSYMRAPMVDYWHQRGFNVIVHPECRNEVVSKADASGSTAIIWDYVTNDKGGNKKYAIGTENHMVQNLKQLLEPQGFEIYNLGDAKLSEFKGMGCGCATMSRNDPPHLVALLDLLHQGKAPEFNLVQPGDVVNEFTGERNRLDADGQAWLKAHAAIALDNMIKITESK